MRLLVKGSFISLTTVALAFMLSGCGGGTRSITPTVPQSNQASGMQGTRTLAEALNAMPSGVKVFQSQTIAIEDSQGAAFFPADVKISKSTEGITVLYGGRAYAFPSTAQIINNAGNTNYYVYPGEVTPPALVGKVPAYVTGQAP